MSIPREVVEAIKDRCDIVDLIGSYVTLRRAGSIYSGLCPFHSEKTPSFAVYPEDQHFFCFGCEAGGDIFTFIMRTENVEYSDAIEILAKRTGVNLPVDSQPQQQGVPRKRIYEMNLIAARFWRECLFDAQIGREAMTYLREKRGLDVPFIKRFGIGYAPNQSKALISLLQQQGYTIEEMRTAFLCGVGEKDGRKYSFDYFRDRVIFPVIDTVGNVVAFSGRDVSGNAKAKYLNSSDTPAFQKRKNLFALNFAKNYCSEQLILCEGNMDVVSLHAAGFQNAVASLGTALTDEQARIMTKYTKQVILAYDSDEAGQRATHRAMGIFAKVGLDVRVLHMKDAKDPDEFIKKFGADRFRQLLKRSSTGFDFKLETILAKHNVELPDEKIKAANDLCAVIAGVSSAAEREVYLSAVSARLGLSTDSLKSDVERIRRAQIKVGRQQESRHAQLSAMNLGDKVNPEAAGSVQAAAAEETIIGLLLLYAEHRNAVKKGVLDLTANDFLTSFHRRAFEAVMSLEESEGGYDFSLLGESFNPDEMGRLAKLEQQRRVMSENGTPVLRGALETLRAAREKKAVKEASAMDGLQLLLHGKRQRIKKPTDET